MRTRIIAVLAALAAGITAVTVAPASAAVEPSISSAKYRCGWVDANGKVQDYLHMYATVTVKADTTFTGQSFTEDDFRYGPTYRQWLGPNGWEYATFGPHTGTTYTETFKLSGPGVQFTLFVKNGATVLADREYVSPYTVYSGSPLVTCAGKVIY
jgi:hypothetical protein